MKIFKRRENIKILRCYIVILSKRYKIFFFFLNENNLKLKYC